jgi:hypothetical protein
MNILFPMEREPKEIQQNEGNNWINSEQERKCMEMQGNEVRQLISNTAEKNSTTHMSTGLTV